MSIHAFRALRLPSVQGALDWKIWIWTGKSRFGMSNPHFEFVTNEKEIRNPFLVVFVGFCVLLGNPKSEL